MTSYHPSSYVKFQQRKRRESEQKAAALHQALRTTKFVQTKGQAVLVKLSDWQRLRRLIHHA
jgi:hypothetical protein